MFIKSKKFPRWLFVIIIIILVLVALFLILKYSGWFNQITGDYINAGDEALEAGEYSVAMQQYAFVTELRYLDSHAAYEGYLKRAAILFGKRNFAEAATELDAAIKLKKNSPEAYLLLGQVQLELDQVEAAVSNLEKALELDGDNPEVMVELGRAVFDLGGQNDRAESLFRQAAEQDTEAQAPAYYLSLVLLDKDIREAEEVLTSTLEKNGSYNKQAEKIKEVLLEIQARADANKNEESDEYQRLLIGWAYAGVGENAAALNVAEQIVTEMTDYRDAWLLKSWAEIELGDYSLAQESLLKAYEIDPTYGQTQYLYAKAETGEQKSDAALESFQKALDLGYDNQDLRRDYAELLISLDKIDLAEEQLRLAYEKDPLDIDTALQYVWFLGEQADDGERALEVATALSKKLRGPQIDAIVALANFYAGEIEEAKSMASTVIVSDTGNALAYFVRAKATGDRDDFIKAIDLDFTGVIAGWAIAEI
ncbi:tetratricopeptide repeat protein [Patescibacteria group bacterium]